MLSRVASVDFETPYSNDFSVVDLGYYKYARDPRCIPYLISVCTDTDLWAGDPRELPEGLLAGKTTFLSHNAAFDEEIALAADERGLFSLPGLRQPGLEWHCTANMSAYIWGVRSLADAAAQGLSSPVSKGVRDRAKGKTVEDMKREGWWDEMVSYAKDDARHCYNLWARYADKWPQFERDLSRWTIEQGRHGVRIDVDALGRGIELMGRIIFEATANLPWIARGRAPGSPIGIAEECRANSIPCPPVKVRDPEAAERWEAEYAPRFPFVMALRNLRKAKKALATLETIQSRLRPDETVAFSLKYAGASTLRWSGDSGWNLQNMAKDPLLVSPDFRFVLSREAAAPLFKEFSAKHSGSSALGVLSDGTTYFDFRGLIIARPGMSLVAVDEGQIEPRILNALAKNNELLDRVRSGEAIYEAHARTTMGWTGGRLKDENPKLYALAKARVLGLGYGCGWRKFILLASMNGIDITEGDETYALAESVDKKVHLRWKAPLDKHWSYSAEAAGTYKVAALKGAPPNGGEPVVFVNKTRQEGGKLVSSVVPLPVYGFRSRVTVDQFRQTNPKITALWREMQDNLEASMGENLTVIGPHEGVLTFRDIRAESRKETDPDTGREYTKFHYTHQDNHRRARLYGGLLVENLIQWVARMVFSEHSLAYDRELRAQDSRQRVLFTVHDEAVAEVLTPADPAAAIALAEGHFARSPTWLPQLPLKGEARLEQRYFK